METHTVFKIVSIYLTSFHLLGVVRKSKNEKNRESYKLKEK